MSIPSIDGIGRLAPIGTDLAASGAPVRPAPVAAADAAATPQQQPKPLRFPWLSRLSQELESVANQRPAFQSAPVLGDHVDKSA